HLFTVLEEIDPKQMDIVVLSVNPNVREIQDIADPAAVVDTCETAVFSQVVHAAEKAGKPVRPVALPGSDPSGVILQAAHQLCSSRVIIGASAAMSVSEQQQKIIAGWRRLSSPGTFRVEVVSDRGEESLCLKPPEA